MLSILLTFLSIKNQIMKKLITLLFIILSVCQFSIAQVAKEVTSNGTFSETLLFIKDNSAITISAVGIDVKIVGNIAVTTFDVTFANPNNRVLEGELNFPLGEGQAVTRFAMDINGVLREAVPVEKEKGQMVFEEVIRQKVDPGLLEKTQGNNYKARVYPIPANGTKRVLIAYEQEIKPVTGGYLYVLPLEFKKPVGKFSVNIEVLKQTIAPVVEKTDIENITFEKWNDSYKASLVKENYTASHPIAFTVPAESVSPIAFAESGTHTNGQQFFYASVKPEILKREKKLPSSIALIWDVSTSNKYDNYDRIVNVLDAYFKKIGNIKIKLVTFSNDIQTEADFIVTAGNWDNLKSTITQLKYDGATQLGCLNLSKYSCDEFILVSDGISNFGNKEIAVTKVPVIVINENQSADHSYLSYIAASTGGAYLNLLKLSNTQAVDAMSNQSFQYISATFDGNEVKEVYPSIPTLVTNDFSVSGLIKTGKAKLILNFGFGTEIVKSIPVSIEVNKDSTTSGIAERMWAVKKINELDMLYEKNKIGISEVGKKYGIVTRNTSLIILDNLADYIRYRIEPPVDMRKDYYAAIDKTNEERLTHKKNQIDIVVKGFEEKKNWWNKEYNQAEKENMPWVTQKGEALNNGGIVTGTIYSAFNNMAISNANIEIGATGNGVVTDANGNFSMVLPAGANTITCKAAGMETQSIKVNSSNLFIWLVKTNALSEAGKEKKMESVRFSPPVQEESIEDAVAAPAPRSAPAISATTHEDTDDALEKSVVITTFKSNSAVGKYIVGGSATKIQSAKIQMAAWDPQTPYMTKIKAVLPEKMYEEYLVQKKEYGHVPSFYLDVADYFFTKGKKEEGLRILSNLAEINLQNHQILRVLAHRLEQLKYYKLSIQVFEEVLKLRREEPQSFRDLGLVYAADGQYQKAVDTLYNVVTKEWNSRFPEVGVLVAGEINALIVKANQNKIKVNTDKIDNRILAQMPVDIRIVLNWDSDNCDIDLWVTDPRNEVCLYSHNLTKTGGAISRDFTGGYGPEEFQIKNALNGKYMVQANYYGTNAQTLTGPTTIQLELYTRYLNNAEKKETVTLRLTQNKEVIKIADLLFEKKSK